MPKVIVSDRDSKFTSLFWRSLMERFGTRLAMSTAYHPQTDGQSEVMVKTLKQMLRHYISHTQKDWINHLPVLEFAYNNSVHPTTKMTPFESDLGYSPASPHSLVPDDMTEVPAAEAFVEAQEARMNTAIENILKAQQEQAAQYNKGRREVEFKEGDLVLLSTKHLNPPFLQTGGKRKLQPKYTGPFRIIRKVGRLSYELDLPVHFKIHPVINLEYLKPFHESSPELRRPQAPPPEPDINEALEEEYEVEEIRGHKRDKKGNLKYLIKWKNYDDHSMTFEPEDNLSNAAEILAEYKSQHPGI